MNINKIQTVLCPTVAFIAYVENLVQIFIYCIGIHAEECVVCVRVSVIMM